MKNIRKKIIMASVCLCMLCWAAMPCFVFGVAETAKIEASKTVSSSTAKPGDEVTYTITATYKATYGDENSALPGFNITDNLPVGTTITNKAVFDYLGNDEEISRTADVTVVAEESGDEPGETPNDTPAELDKSPDCGDHFMDFWWFVDIVKGWIFN